MLAYPVAAACNHCHSQGSSQRYPPLRFPAGLRFYSQRRRGGDLQNRFGGITMNRSNKAVPSAGERLHIPRLIRRVAQGLTQLIHRRVETLFEIDEGCALPQVPLQLVTANHPPGIVQQEREDLEWLAL